MEKIKIYLDSGASLPKDLFEFCECYQFPYDLADRPKKNPPKLAAPCELRCCEANCRWDEADFTWEDSAHAVPEKIKLLIGKANKADYKHLGSAIRMSCKIFLSSDKSDIWNVRKEIEAECGIKVFLEPLEFKDLRAYLSAKSCP
jgi:hypothetical protein